MLRAAVIQVVGHLVERAVPPSQRVPLFEQAMDLLDEAGWGLDELAGAASPGPAQDELLRTLGLQRERAGGVPPASQRAPVPPGLRSDEGATREGGASRGARRRAGQHCT
jgi:hypothetical protein